MGCGGLRQLMAAMGGLKAKGKGLPPYISGWYREICGVEADGVGLSGQYMAAIQGSNEIQEIKRGFQEIREKNLRWRSRHFLKRLEKLEF